MAAEVPVMEAAAVSVAEMVGAPAVFKVTANDPAPLVRVALAGRTAAASVEVKWMMPVYPETLLLPSSRAVMVVLNGVPAVALDGATTDRRVAAPALTAIELEIPVIEDVTESGAGRV